MIHSDELHYVMPHHPRYKQETKDFILNQLQEKNGRITAKRGTLKNLTSQRSAPRRETIWKWRKKLQLVREGRLIQKKTGPKNKLSELELSILGGKMLSRRSHGKKVDIAFIRHFVEDSFGVKVSAAWVSKATRKLGFRSKIARKDELHKNDASRAAMRQWLLRIRNII